MSKPNWPINWVVYLAIPMRAFEDRKNYPVAWFVMESDAKDFVRNQPVSSEFRIENVHA